MATENWVNIGSGNGLLPDGTKPLLNQCWLIIGEVLWHSPEGNFTWNAQDIYPWRELENYWFKITSASPRDQWVKRFHWRWLLCPKGPIDRKSALVQIMAWCQQERLKRRNTLGSLDQYAAQNSKHARPPIPSQPPTQKVQKINFNQAQNR